MKSRTIAVLLAASLLILGATAGRDLVRAEPAGGNIAVEGSSTLHAWKVESRNIGGYLRLDRTAAADPKHLATWLRSNGNTTAMEAIIPVNSISSGNNRMDKLMREALKAHQHKEIRYQLNEAVARPTGGPALVLDTRGKLTIAGVSRDVQMEVSVRQVNDRLVVTGQAPLKMTWFGITPPTAMMGTVRTGDDVQVSFEWQVRTP